MHSKRRALAITDYAITEIAVFCFVLCGWEGATHSITVLLMRRCLIVGGNYKTIIIMISFFPQIVIDGRRIRWKWWSRQPRHDTMMVMKRCCCGRLWCDITWLLSMHSVSPPNSTTATCSLLLHWTTLQHFLPHVFIIARSMSLLYSYVLALPTSPPPTRYDRHPVPTTSYQRHCIVIIRVPCRVCRLVSDWSQYLCRRRNPLYLHPSVCMQVCCSIKPYVCAARGGSGGGGRGSHSLGDFSFQCSSSSSGSLLAGTAIIIRAYPYADIIWRWRRLNGWLQSQQIIIMITGCHLHTQWLLLTCIFLIGIFAIEVDIAINLFSLRTRRRRQEEEEVVLLIPILYAGRVVGVDEDAIINNKSSFLFASLAKHSTRFKGRAWKVPIKYALWYGAGGDKRPRLRRWLLQFPLQLHPSIHSFILWSYCDWRERVVCGEASCS